MPELPRTFLSGSRDNSKAVFLITTLTAVPPEVEGTFAAAFAQNIYVRTKGVKARWPHIIVAA